MLTVEKKKHRKWLFFFFFAYRMLSDFFANSQKALKANEIPLANGSMEFTTFKGTGS